MFNFKPSTEVLYREIAGAKQLCSEFHFDTEVGIGWVGEAGFISFDKGGRIMVKVGYVWDGASGPTIDTPSSVCASLGHDVMYELMRLRLIPDTFKAIADKWFYERLLTDGMLPYRAYAWYKAVCVFGIEGTLPQNQPLIYRAPIPFPSEPRETFEPIPGYRIPR